MEDSLFLSKIKTLKTWSNKGNRSPHKPLLILYALGLLVNGKEKLLYKESVEDLKRLLIAFGPHRKIQQPRYPFVRLISDGIWDLNTNLEIQKNKDYTDNSLIENNTSGSFTTEVRNELSSKPNLINTVIQYLLDRNFPESLHREILLSCGLNSMQYTFEQRRKRDPKFREIVFKEYRYSCAVCNYSLRIGNSIAGLEAAHVKWHALDGPDEINNGIALCSLHHKLFDLGAFTIESNYNILISDFVNNDVGMNQVLEPISWETNNLS